VFDRAKLRGRGYLSELLAQHLEKLNKAVDPSPFRAQGRNVADGPLNYQNQFFDSLSETISLLEYECARPENSDLFGCAPDPKCPNVKKSTHSNSHSHLSLGI
jgi:hypothetical protein